MRRANLSSNRARLAGSRIGKACRVTTQARDPIEGEWRNLYGVSQNWTETVCEMQRKGFRSNSHCRPEQKPQPRGSVAATPGNVVVIEGLLITSIQIGLVRTAFLFAHIGKHFAIPPRRLVDDELPVSQLLKFLDLLFEVLPALLKFLNFSVGPMQMMSDERFEDICTARSI
jgi:hypothetical protein